MRPLDIIATLNYHLLEPQMLNALLEKGATIFRINGAHAQPEEIANYVKEVRAALGSRIKILVDLPGNKIRTSVLSQPIVLTAGKTFELRGNQINYPKFLSHLEVGDVLYANDSLFRFKVESIKDDHVRLSSATDGKLGSNKGMHLIGKSIPLPFLFERDRQLIERSIAAGVDYLGFSFVRTADDVREAAAALQGTPLKMIIKVETAPAIRNLGEILDAADEFLVDRGDLACDIGIANIDRTQKQVLKAAQAKGKKVFFATQFLHSMVHNNVPLIAEACGLTDVLRLGVHGLQLSEETAVGKYPLEILETVRQVRESVAEETRLRPKKDPKAGLVLWLTGRSGAGKTEISKRLIPQIESKLMSVCLIDGDEFRAFFDNKAGYSKEERLRNLENIAFTAYQASKSFDVVVVSSLSPYRVSRANARRKISNFHEIFIDCSQKTCVERDPKGNYKKALAGGIDSYVGVTEEYETPEAPELVVNTEKRSADQAAGDVFDYLVGREKR